MHQYRIDFAFRSISVQNKYKARRAPGVVAATAMGIGGLWLMGVAMGMDCESGGGGGGGAGGDLWRRDWGGRGVCGVERLGWFKCCTCGWAFTFE